MKLEFDFYLHEMKRLHGDLHCFGITDWTDK